MIRAAGFVVVDDAAIWGAGLTEEKAWAEVREGMRLARIPHESEVDTEDTYCPRYWSEDRFEVHEATAALLKLVDECGGDIAWGQVGDVCCTVQEEEVEADGGLVLVRSDAGDGGWSLHAPGSTDEDIAEGDAPALLTGEAEMGEDGEWSAPTAADYAEALVRLGKEG